MGSLATISTEALAKLAFLAVIILFVAGCTPLNSLSGSNLTEQDMAAVLAVEEAYVEAWRANDADAVMATLAPSAIIIPGGMEPISGLGNIRAFWFPDDGSTTTITRFSSTTEITGGSGTLAYAIGEGELEFTYEIDGDASDFVSRSVHMTIYELLPNGDWKIARRIWHALPNE